MAQTLRERAEKTASEVQDILGVNPNERPKEVTDAIEMAIIRALVKERQRCADVAFKCCPEDKDKAYKIAREVGRVKSVLITNLSSMR
ncbi:MAG TPA: hypothetical protein ENI69_08755 [Rhodospirillales bacterium]|nr:hypothetical protein [Rhodospirillales bacterium]